MRRFGGVRFDGAPVVIDAHRLPRLALRAMHCEALRRAPLASWGATTGLPIFTMWELTPEKYDALRAQCQ